MSESIVTPEERERFDKSVAWLKARRALTGNIPTLLRWARGWMGVVR